LCPILSSLRLDHVGLRLGHPRRRKQISPLSRLSKGTERLRNADLHKKSPKRHPHRVDSLRLRKLPLPTKSRFPVPRVDNQTPLALSCHSEERGQRPRRGCPSHLDSSLTRITRGESSQPASEAEVPLPPPRRKPVSNQPRRAFLHSLTRTTSQHLPSLAPLQANPANSGSPPQGARLLMSAPWDDGILL